MSTLKKALDKIISNIEEVKARKDWVIPLVGGGDEQISRLYNHYSEH